MPKRSLCLSFIRGPELLRPSDTSDCIILTNFMIAFRSPFFLSSFVSQTVCNECAPLFLSLSSISIHSDSKFRRDNSALVSLSRLTAAAAATPRTFTSGTDCLSPATGCTVRLRGRRRGGGEGGGRARAPNSLPQNLDTSRAVLTLVGCVSRCSRHLTKPPLRRTSKIQK